MNVFILVELCLILILILSWCTCDASLIASSKILLCSRKNASVEPKQLDGEVCNKKFVIALTVENGKVNVFFYILKYGIVIVVSV